GQPAFEHPAFDYESRIVIAEVAGTTFASVYVPNGRKNIPAKMGFLESSERFAGQLEAAGRRAVICGDINIARTDMDVHPKERKPKAIGQLPEERGVLEGLRCH